MNKIGKLCPIVCVLLLASVACTSTPPSGSGGVSITTPLSPLVPAFDRSVNDYATRCGGQASVAVSAPEGTLVSVDGQAARSGSFVVDLPGKRGGQGFEIVVEEPGKTPSTHHVRCLPDDFPVFDAHRSGSPAAEYYMTVPGGPFPGSNYSVLFDENGVPVWWDPPGDAFFSDLLPNGNVIVTPHYGDSVEERELDGSLVRSITPTVGKVDGHDVELLPNGNYLVVSNTISSGWDLSSLCAGGICAPSNAQLLDQVVQELTPDGTLVWEWRVSDHISPLDTGPDHIGQLLLIGPPYDFFHWNSVEYTPSGIVLSFRNLDAVYKIDRSTGDILWKLGGVPAPESLTVQGDTVAPHVTLSSQHDARILPDGTLTVYDNATGLQRLPRVVRFDIDISTNPGTATLLEDQRDAAVPSSLCCGSARKLPGGNWAVGWGGTNRITESAPDGTKVFQLEFFNTILVYRAVPVLPGVLEIEDLRAAMDARFG